jgi:predicted membrane protein
MTHKINQKVTYKLGAKRTLFWYDSIAQQFGHKYITVANIETLSTDVFGINIVVVSEVNLVGNTINLYNKYTTIANIETLSTDVFGTNISVVVSEVNLVENTNLYNKYTMVANIETLSTDVFGINIFVVVSEVNLVGNTNKWWVDTGATRHIRSDNKMFSTYKYVKYGEQFFGHCNPLIGEISTNSRHPHVVCIKGLD